MSLSRLARRAHYIPGLLQHKSLASSFLPNEFVGSSYNLIRGTSGYRNDFGCTLWRAEFVCEYNTSSLNKYRPFTPFGKNCVGRAHPLFQIQRHYASVVSQEQKSKKMLMYLTALVFVMVGCTYAAVPLYRRFCQATGYGGTVQRRETVEEKIARHK